MLVNEEARLLEGTNKGLMGVPSKRLRHHKCFLGGPSDAAEGRPATPVESRRGAVARIAARQLEEDLGGSRPQEKARPVSLGFSGLLTNGDVSVCVCDPSDHRTLPGSDSSSGI